ncbi:D-amino-acid oxidase [Fusarium albosuccineum]|uniref:D-amino-acid oxidase n=1 Tax=Fusarium albosuccineum TaxID=1237068 RepID=A0A8H4PIH7_9HYPO|nr:D-amino-acid oxidase [Fusarium albosuccineum]
MARITIVGSGIIGLAIAAQLSRNHDITVVARNLPGDEASLEWASLWAGANFVAGGCSSDRDKRMQLDSFAELWRLAARFPESSVKRIPMEDFFDDERNTEEIWWKDFMPGFRLLPKDQLPKGAKGGSTYMTVVLNPHIFLPWLKRNLESSGVKFKRMNLESLSDAGHLGHDVLVNATGAGPAYLSDIKDTNMELLRGQTIVIKSDYKKCLMRDDGKDYTYVIPRLDGTAIIGGIRDPDILNTQVSDEVNRDIVRRVHKCLPEHFSADLADYEIVGYNVGIRPYRSSGMRIEKEVKDGQNIVHAYGITGGGYIFSFGVARQAVKLVDEFLFPGDKAKL